MSGKYFLDTNIFVYTFDATAPQKNKRARILVERALRERTGIISYQVIQEFLNVATRKFKIPMTVPEARLYLKRVLSPLCTVFPSQALYEQALDIKEKNGLSFYDAIIVAGSLQGGCRKLYTEDLQHHQEIDDVLIENPFFG